VRAGVPLETSLNKLPEAFKLAVYQDLLAEPVREVP
jgi:hypothetical protein